MKKHYSKPIMEQVEMLPQSIICVSAGFGEGSSGAGGGTGQIVIP